MPVVFSWEEDDGSLGIASLDIEEEETYDYPSTCTTHPVEGGGVITDQVQLGNPTITITGYVSNKPTPSNDLTAGSFKQTPLTLPGTKTFTTKQTKLDVPGSKINPNVGSLLAAGINAIGSAISGPLKIPARAYGPPEKRNVSVNAWTLNDPSYSRAVEFLEALKGVRDSRRRVDVATDFTFMGGCILKFTIPRKPEDGEGCPFVIVCEQIRTVYAQDVDTPKPSEPLTQKRKATGSKATVPLTTDETKKSKTLLLKGLLKVLGSGDLI